VKSGKKKSSWQLRQSPLITSSQQSLLTAAGGKQDSALERRKFTIQLIDK
jgi:hypothetical protein